MDHPHYWCSVNGPTVISIVRDHGRPPHEEVESPPVLLELIVSYKNGRQKSVWLVVCLPFDKEQLVKTLLLACPEPAQVYKISACLHLYDPNEADRKNWNKLLNGPLKFFARMRLKIYFNPERNGDAETRECFAWQQELLSSVNEPTPTLHVFDTLTSRQSFMATFY